jgi:hypothetical protein
MKRTVALLCTALISAITPTTFAGSAHAANGGAATVTPIKRPVLTSNSAIAEEIAGASWQCEWTENAKAQFALTFNARGQFFVTRNAVADPFPGEWTISNGKVTWSDAAGRLYSLKVLGDRMTGETSTLDLRQSRGRVYDGKIDCTRADSEIASGHGR